MPRKGYKQTKKHQKNTSKAMLGKKNALGHCQSIITKQKIKDNHAHLSGKNHPMFGKFETECLNWKGNNISYSRLHGWVIQHLGQPTKCEHCGKDNLTKGQIHWANKDHKYKRNLKDWIRLCVSCHRKYDKQFNTLHI